MSEEGRNVGRHRQPPPARTRREQLGTAVALALVLVLAGVGVSWALGAPGDLVTSTDAARQPTSPPPASAGDGTTPPGAPTTSAPAEDPAAGSTGVSGTTAAASAPARPPRAVQGVKLKRYSPAEWQRILAAREAARLERERAAAAREPVTIRVGTFNVLGSQHTAPGGDRRRYPPASRRTPMAAGLIGAHGVDVIGLQELQEDQLNGLQRLTGMAAFPGYQFGARETDNSILYDTGVFEFVSGDSFTIRFMNADRPQTILRLRHRATGREMYFLNMHASAGEGKYAVSRRNGHYAAISVVNRLKQEGLPVFLMGDMNDRAEFFCRVAPPTGLVASIGGSTSGGCRPAGALAVDWVLATAPVSWSRYWEDRSTLHRLISDHHFVSATATIPGVEG